MPDKQELIICIPGPWENRNDFLAQVIQLEPMGNYIFAGGILANPSAHDHVPLDFQPHDDRMAEAFEIAGQGKISDETLTRIGQHKGVAYLFFSMDIREERERILKYTQVLQRLGGFAVKLESSGTAHEWERWFSLLPGSPFDMYCSAVVLLGGEDVFYSCGMHHFGLPECSVPRSLPINEAAELINQFNFFRIVDEPILETGHTFSMDEDSPRYRMFLEKDTRYEEDESFHNPHGLWRLELA
jgi:hypothetical protein